MIKHRDAATDEERNIVEEDASVISTLTIDDIFPTANVYIRMPSLRRGQWHRQPCNRHRQDLRDAWYWMILEQVARYSDSIAPAKRKRYVKVISYRRGDPDEHNLVLCADKLALDNLIKLGVLVDDNKKWCKLEVEGRKAGKRGKRTVIEIREG